MRRLLVSCAVLFAIPVAAVAVTGTINSVSPRRIVAGSGEYFLTAYGTDLNGAYRSIGLFDGPAGHIEIVANAQDSGSTTFWVPSAVVNTPGSYTIVVRAVDEQYGQRVTRDSSAADFDVIGSAPEQHTPPTVTVPASVTTEATSHSGATVTFTATAVDSNGNPLPVSCSPASGSLFPISSTLVTCTANDGISGSSASFTVTVADTTPPQLTLPHDVTTNDATVAYDASAFDLVDGVVPISCSPASGSTFPAGTTTTVQCNAHDSRGNVASGSFHVTVGPMPSNDHTPPVLHLPGDIVVTTNVGYRSAVVNYDANAIDDVDGPVPVTCMPPSGATYGIGVATVNCSASDMAGNTSTGTFTITVNLPPADGTPPSLNLPAHVYAQATSASGAAVTYLVWAFDDGDGQVGVQCTPPSGSTFALGTTTVSCWASDRADNIATGSFPVTVQDTPPPPSTDTTPPVLQLPNDIVIRANSGISSAVITYTAIAIDDVDGRVPVDCSPPSGVTMGVGTVTARCSASDRSGNTSTGTFTITVLPRSTPDTSAPQLSLPPDQTLEATSPYGATVTYVASATDDIDGAVPANCTPVSGSTFALGTTAVRCTAQDRAGNIATGAFAITVRDTTPPAINSITASPDVLSPADHRMVPVMITVDATDLVSPNVAAHIIDVESNQPPNGSGDGNTETDWTITGALTVDLRAERSGGNDRIYTITIEAADESGNTTTGVVTLRVTQPKHRATAITAKPASGG